MLTADHASGSDTSAKKILPAQERHRGVIRLASFVEGPRELDIGCGNGRLLCRLAERHPGSHFIGIELVGDLADRAAYRAERKHLENVTVVHAEAHQYLRENIESSSIATAHIYFPTPYPAAIGLRERLLSLPFLQQVYRVLVPGGMARFLTDHPTYYKELVSHASTLAQSWWPIGWPSLQAGQPDDFFAGTPWELRTRATRATLSLTLLK